MGFNAVSAQVTPDGIDEIIIEFSDNALLIDLCGAFDRNLAQIEHVIGVQIIRRGNQLSLIGDGVSRGQATAALQNLYTKLEAGRPVDTGEIDGELQRICAAGAGHSEENGAPNISKDAFIEISTRKKTVQPRTLAQNNYVSSLYKNELAFGIGPAGTGKTYLAVAVGVNMLVGGHVDKIILSRPAVEAGERLGFLPGDMKDKVDPYMQPLYDALNDFLPEKQLARMLEEKQIEIAPLAFMRGRTLSNAFVVLDEAQNATTMQMKMFLTRLGKGSRMVVTGDRTQIDLPRNTQSGLADAERLLGGIKKISFNYFTSKDVVRHPLVARIIEAYDADSDV